MTVIEQRILQIITLLYGFVSVILASGTTGRTTTLATFNAALSNSTGNVDARASILINQVAIAGSQLQYNCYTYNMLNLRNPFCSNR